MKGGKMFRRKIQPQEQEVEEQEEVIRKPMMHKPVAPVASEEEDLSGEEEEQQTEQPQKQRKPLTIIDLMNAITEDRNFMIQLNARIEALEASLFRLKALV